jgi:hypothetical protein
MAEKKFHFVLLLMAKGLKLSLLVSSGTLHDEKGLDVASRRPRIAVINIWHVQRPHSGPTMQLLLLDVLTRFTYSADQKLRSTLRSKKYR